MSNFQTVEIIKGLKRVPDALADSSVLPPKFRKKILQKLDLSETTVAVYSDNLIDDHEKWDDKKASIDASVRGKQSGEEVGLEALAWYVSFHHNQSKWGIFIPVSSLHYLNEILEIKIHSQVDLGQISKQILFNHELYHFLTDLAISQLELLTKHSMYRPHKQLYKNEKLHLSSNEDYNDLEENLANAFMLEEIQTSISKNQLKKIISWVETMPRGYRDGANTFLKSRKNKLENDNLNRYAAIVAAKTQLNVIEPALDLSVFIPKPLSNIVVQCPVYILDDTQEHGLDDDIVRFFQKMEAIEETKHFKKMFVKLPQKIQLAWKKKREELKVCLPKYPQFRKFKELYSVYLPDGFRVHFSKPQKNETTWLATGIGDHQRMGHGK